MTKSLPQNETRERIMDVAENLFMTRGYSAVRLRDIADEVGMKHASLYYYVPKGKEQLFVAVVRRSMARHEHEMTRLIGDAGDDIHHQAYAVSDWLVSQPPIDMVRMSESDLHQIDKGTAAELTTLMLDSLTRPLILALERAREHQTVDVINPGVAAMSLITLIQTVHHIPAMSIPEGRTQFGRKLVDMLMYGWLRRT